MRLRAARGCLLWAALIASVACTEHHKPSGERGDASPPSYVATGDLAAIRKRGELRVIIPAGGESYLPRRGLPQAQDVALARQLGRRLGVRVVFVRVADHSALLRSLVAGRGDLVAAQLTVTPSRAKQVAFSRPRFTVDEWVVGRQGAPHLPHRVADLAGRQIDVRLSSSFAETLRAVQAEVPSLHIAAVPENVDTEQLVYEVGAGQRPLTVVDSHLLAAIEAYDPDIERLFTIATGRHIAWAIRRGNPALKAYADAFLIESSLTTRVGRPFVGDLDAIRKRHVLRVLTANNAASYFLYRGRQMGFDYELSAMLAKQLGVQLVMVVPPSHADLIPWLLQGRGDMIAASLTITPQRQRKVRFSTPYLHVQEMIVQRVSDPPLTNVSQLAGKTIVVRKSSSYYQHLVALQRQVGPIHIVTAPEDEETEDLVAAVGRGQIPMTVCDSHLLAIELAYRDDVRGTLPLVPPGVVGTGKGAHDKSIAFGVRPANPELLDAVDAFVARTYRSRAYNLAKRRYFASKRHIDQAKTQRVAKSGQLSPYDRWFKKYAAEYGLDWRLMAAQAFEESRFNPNATSWVGARGIFQLMPSTAEQLGFHHLRNPQSNIHAGVEYMARLVAQTDPSVAFNERLHFALAAYNVGHGHVLDARRLAKRLGLDDRVWFGNVGRAMRLLAKPHYYRHARYGYCRGSEPARYVRDIQTRYENYVKLLRP